MAASNRLATRGARTKILFVLDEFPGPYAGTETQFWLLVQGLDRAQYDPTILLLRPSDYLKKHAGSIPVHVIDVPRLKTIGGITRIVRAALWARRNGFKVAHTFLNDSAIAFPLPLSMSGCKVIVSRRDLGFWYTRFNLAILRLQARFVSAVIANCEAVKDVVIRAERFPSARVEVIYNGLARSPTRQAPLARASFGIPEDAALVVVVANLRPLKRITDVVRVIAELRLRMPRPVHVLVVGEDRPGDASESHQGELESLAAELGVRDQIHFAGRMDDPMPAIAIADVGVLPSDTEGLSNVIIEYMSAGKPVVASNVGGNAELVQDAKTGYLVEPRDVPALATALQRLFTDPTRAASLGRAGKQRADEMFTATAMIHRHQVLYERLLSTNS